MTKYEKTYYSSNSSNNSSNNLDSLDKPLYYNDYVVTGQNKNNNKCLCLVSILLSIFVFSGSILDLIYSYIKIDKCQEISYFTTLDDWLRVNGVFGICYYFFMMTILSVFYYNEGRNHINNGYRKMSVNRENNEENNEKCQLLYRVTSTFLTVVMLLLFAIGSYIYFSFFYTYCTSYSIIVYMWVRIISGLLSSIGLIVFINI